MSNDKHESEIMNTYTVVFSNSSSQNSITVEADYFSEVLHNNVIQFWIRGDEEKEPILILNWSFVLYIVKSPDT